MLEAWHLLGPTALANHEEIDAPSSPVVFKAVTIRVLRFRQIRLHRLFRRRGPLSINRRFKPTTFAE